jgi:hypothetical protein
MKKEITELVSMMRLLEQDHDPDGWPAVQMKDISALCDAIEWYDEIADQIHPFVK